MNLDVATVLRATGARVFRVHNGSAVEGDLLPIDLAARFSSVSTDSRAADVDSLFVALAGEHVDGHDFVPAGLAAGALGCLVSRLPDVTDQTLPGTRYLFLTGDPLLALQRIATTWRLGHRAEVVGITGSVGKTTAKEIVAGVLGNARRVLKSEGNLNTEIGMPLMLLGLTDQHDVAVLEMGMYVPGDIALLAGIAAPRIGIVTNVAPIHLERAGSIERIARAKSELVAALPADGVAILNADDPWTRAMAESSGIARSVLVGTSADSDFRATNIQLRGLEGTVFDIEAEGRRVPMETRVAGQHTVLAFLAAAATARELGLSWDEIQEGSARVRLDVRQRILRRDSMLIIDDSYNAAPMSVAAALDLLRESPGTKIAVLGDMLELGADEEQAHRGVGERAASVADWLVARGPRSAWTAEAAAQRGLPGSRVRHVDDNEQALEAIREIMGSGGRQWAILVKGSRGMRMEEVVNGLQGEP
jgi:UDP-N-acetylmuramoyl-tripeptide--D-alanyl-D-alanine ligase